MTRHKQTQRSMKKNLNVLFTALQTLVLQPVSDLHKTIMMVKNILFFPSSLVPVLVKGKKSINII